MKVRKTIYIEEDELELITKKAKDMNFILSKYINLLIWKDNFNGFVDQKLQSKYKLSKKEQMLLEMAKNSQ